MPRLSDTLPWRLLLLAPAAVLAWLGVAQLVEGWQEWPLHRYIHASWWQADRAPSLAKAIARPPGRADGRAWSAYGQALLAVAHAATTPEDRDDLLRQASAATRKALTLSPAQAATWARLSLIALNEGDPELAGKALRRSLELAPNGVNLAWPRAKIGLYLWTRLTLASQSAIIADIGRLMTQPPSLALPYPQQALSRYAESIGRSALLADIMRGLPHAR